MFNYFIHPSNLQKMDAVLKMRMQEGAAGYGIFMMLLELLRDSAEYTTAYDPNVLAWALHEPDVPKLKAVCEDYGLFSISEDKKICCPWLTSVMAQHEEKKKKLSEAGKRSAAARASKAEQPQPAPQPNPNEAATTLTPPLQGGSNVVGDLSQQTKTNKRNNKKSNNPSNPLEGVEGVDIFSDDFIKEVGRDKSPLFDPSEDAHFLPSGPGHNTNPLFTAGVTWRLSARQVFVLYKATRECEVGSAPFMALLAALKHCRDTNFMPKFPFEYFMSRVKESAQL